MVNNNLRRADDPRSRGLVEDDGGADRGARVTLLELARVVDSVLDVADRLLAVAVARRRRALFEVFLFSCFIFIISVLVLSFLLDLRFNQTIS